MNTSQLTDLAFLLQRDVIEGQLPSIGREQWQTLYRTDDSEAYRLGIWCALLDDRAAARAMEQNDWDLRIGSGQPGFVQSWSSGEGITTYHRFGNDNGVRPFILHRSFADAFPDYRELDEEFRLYHNLAEDKHRGRLLSFDKSGREIEVAQITANEVRVQLKYLRQFQAGTGLYLAIYIDSMRFSMIPFATISPQDHRSHYTNTTTRWSRTIGDGDFLGTYRTSSHVLGKVILPPPTREKAGIWPFNTTDTRQALSFIIGVDAEGNPVEHSSDPTLLSNYFGANPGNPHYLTPVYFRREVLGKYFAEPERYRVADGELTCLSLWSCRIDNDHASHVVIFLGDLGRDLPYEEQLHWRQFNVVPGESMSQTNYVRSIVGDFAEPQSYDLTFRNLYNNILESWEAAQGWTLFLPLAPGDKHLLDTIRIPVTNAQPEFDEQIVHLTKLLVDSLNEKVLEKRAGVLEEGAKGLRKFAGFLEATNCPEAQSIIQFLRDLQTLRSKGSAHRKGHDYQKSLTKLGIDSMNTQDAVRHILEAATKALRTLYVYYCLTSEGSNGAL